ncbi:hypothetical protein PH210_22455 [Paenibacillus sp. BSR1-1]|nr:hypothetical protein [Paenibacillus sp. BSR1-1]MDN3018938.1 hypothetical protein [Paenibacillus sp. BSR1-1]
MTKDELISIIRKELTNNPQRDSLDIAKMYNIPTIIVQIYKRWLMKELT